MRCRRWRRTPFISIRGSPAFMMTAIQSRCSSPMALVSAATSLVAPMACTPASATSLSVTTGRSSPAAWRGAGWCRWKLPAHMRRNVGVNWVGPGGHVINYQLRRGELLNFVGVVERDWRVESWSEKGSREECAADFPGWHDDIRAIIRNIEQPYKWALLGRAPLTRFSHGRATLLGDAAHPTLPMLAQGANMAIEDGMVLARCLNAYDDAETALAHYDAARVERTAKLVQGANDMAKRFHNPALADAAGARAYVDAQWNEATVKQRYDWLFQYDATTVAI